MSRIKLARRLERGIVLDIDMKKMTREVRLTHWTQIIREQKESGQSIRVWCNENSVKEKTYYYWQRQLRKAACEHLASSQLAMYRPSLPVQGFAEVKLESSPDRIPLLQGFQTKHIFVEIGEVRISAGSDYSPEKMAVLLRGLLRP